MHTSIEWHGDQFNVKLHSKEGADNFLNIRGCRIVQGKDGEFVSWPATKSMNTNRWWNHVWANELFAEHVLDLAKKSRPAQNDQYGNSQSQYQNDPDDDPAF